MFSNLFDQFFASLVFKKWHVFIVHEYELIYFLDNLPVLEIFN